MPDYGTARADFPGGDAGLLYRSIRRILELPADTRLFTCHDYKPAGRDRTLLWVARSKFYYRPRPESAEKTRVAMAALSGEKTRRSLRILALTPPTATEPFKGCRGQAPISACPHAMRQWIPLRKALTKSSPRPDQGQGRPPDRDTRRPCRRCLAARAPDPRRRSLSLPRTAERALPPPHAFHDIPEEGTRYRSLSALARKITGTPWSGPLFFGLKPNRSAIRRSSQPAYPAGEPMESGNAAG
jgi:hypothetical protein